MDAIKLICRRRIRRLAKHVWSVVREHEGKEAEVMDDLEATLPWPLLIELAVILARIFIDIYFSESNPTLFINSVSSVSQLGSEELFLLADDLEEDGLADYSKAVKWIASNSHIVVQDVGDE